MKFIWAACLAHIFFWVWETIHCLLHERRQQRGVYQSQRESWGGVPWDLLIYAGQMRRCEASLDIGIGHPMINILLGNTGVMAVHLCICFQLFV